MKKAVDGKERTLSPLLERGGRGYLEQRKRNRPLFTRSEKTVPDFGILITKGALVKDISRMIEEARSAAAAVVNAGLTMLYWQIGGRINTEILKGGRAGYGEEILPTLSAKLTPVYGRGFKERNLARMIKFYECFPDEKIVVSMIRYLSWSHFVEILSVKEQIAREFYAGMCRVERWSVRMLRSKIDGMLYERTALSKKPEKLARLELAELREEDKLTPDLVFRDPYILDFLGLKGYYQEKDLESAILNELEKFLIELGAGFCFLARQKRIVIDNEDFYIDLLFYHRKLKRLVVIELKLGKFKATHKGQMELYLRWLEKHETESGENSPLGIILCTEGNREQVELLQLDKSGIHVAEYLTELPSKTLLRKKLHSAVTQAQQLLAYKNQKEKGLK